MFIGLCIIDNVLLHRSCQAEAMEVFWESFWLHFSRFNRPLNIVVFQNVLIIVSYREIVVRHSSEVFKLVDGYFLGQGLQ